TDRRPVARREPRHRPRLPGSHPRGCRLVGGGFHPDTRRAAPQPATGDTVTRQTNALAVTDYEPETSLPEAAEIAFGPARPIDPALAQFGAHTASFTSQALGAEWSCFYYL